MWALKGDSRGVNKPVWPAKFSRRNKGNVPLFTINVDASKKFVIDHLEITEPGPGYCHFPRGRDKAYYRQFSSEFLVTKYTKSGFPKKVWPVSMRPLVNRVN